jgi:hypothetical protein
MSIIPRSVLQHLAARMEKALSFSTLMTRMTLREVEDLSGPSFFGSLAQRILDRSQLTS